MSHYHFLEYFMCALKKSGGLGDGFRDSKSAAPLSKGIASIDDGLTWAVKYSTNNYVRDDERYSEVVNLCMPGISVTVSGYVGCSLAKKGKQSR